MRATIRSALLGITAFVLLFGLGDALAADVPSASDTDNTLGATVTSDAPEINTFDVTNAGDTSFLHEQLDVLTTFYFNVTLEDDNGWADLNWTQIRTWYDGGSSEIAFETQTGANRRAVLNYTNVAPWNAPALSEWSVEEGNIVYNSGDSQIFTNVANQNYTFKLSFQLNGQIRQAADPNTVTAGSYNDLDSWNAEVRAKDNGTDNPVIVNQSNVTDVYHEFGVFQFTSVSIGANWDAGTIAPGASGTSGTITVTHRSNRDFTMTVWFDTNLTSGGNEITVPNINITAAGDAGDAITSDTSFAGLGETNEVYIHGSASTNKSHDTANDEETTGVQFRVFVPFGTPPGSYTATLTIKVEQP